MKYLYVCEGCEMESEFMEHIFNCQNCGKEVCIACAYDDDQCRYCNPCFTLYGPAPEDEENDDDNRPTSK